jgi:catechol 2,3-dioxygenase-like lactoylglutathione lyase family enzyme
VTELVAGIVGRDLDALVAFYTGVMRFDFEQRREFPAFGTVISLRRDAARLKLFFPHQPVDAAVAVEPWFRPGGWRYAALHLESPAAVDGLAAAVAGGGGRVQLAPSEHRPGARMAVVMDPEQNAWELLYDPDAPGGGTG